MNDNKRRVIILEPIDYTELSLHLYEENNIEVTMGPHVTNKKDGYTEKQLIEFANEYDAMIGMSREKITEKVLNSGKRLRTVGKFGIGVDHIDVDAATKAGILVTNTPVINTTVAEFTVGLILSVLKKMTYNDKYLREGNWRDSSTSGIELEGRTLGLVGFGGIGREVVKRFSGWGLNFIAYDPYLKQEMVDQLNVKLVDWDTLFKESDIISLHLPLTTETLSSVSYKEFEMMKPTSVVVNTARGKIIDHKALVNAISENKIWGAGLDVFETEPLPKEDELLKYDNVIVSAHTSGWTKESLTRMSMQAAKNCIAALNDEKPQFIVNRNAVDSWEERFIGK